jgi:hypothetical protein
MSCDCREKIDERLREQNLRLIGYAVTTPNFKVVPTVNTEWVDPEKAPKGMKNRPTKMFASHCPFCGKAIEVTPTPKETK